MNINITTKNILTAIDIVLLTYMVNVVLVHAGIFSMPDIKIKDIWMMSSLAFALATIAWFHLQFEGK